MQGDTAVLTQLNRILTNELTAINQYFLHARILKNWGLLRLASKVFEESLGEMKHADWLIDRVLMLDGLPNMQNLHKLKIGETVLEMQDSDLALERLNQSCLKEAIAVCEEARDFVSRDVLLTILDDTEEHIDWLETQKDLVSRVGEQAYTFQQMFGAAGDYDGGGEA